MSVNKIELRKKLLAGMCKCAEGISSFYYLGEDSTSFYFNLNECPRAFKPNVADKFIFNKIIDKVIDEIIKEKKYLKFTNPDVIGASIMAQFYYPYYGEWINLDISKIQSSPKHI